MGSVNGFVFQSALSRRSWKRSWRIVRRDLRLRAPPSEAWNVHPRSAAVRGVARRRERMDCRAILDGFMGGLACTPRTRGGSLLGIRSPPMRLVVLALLAFLLPG